jgi:chemotaxis protein CheX
MNSEEITIAKHFIKAAQDILQTMANLHPVVGAPYVKREKTQEGDLSALIGVTGDRRGTISITFQRNAAYALLVGMLGDDVHDVQNDMEDVVGEITNMVSGQARASLVETGLTMHGSTPTIIAGQGHTLHHKASGPPIAIPFELGDGKFTIEFCFETNK